MKKIISLFIISCCVLISCKKNSSPPATIGTNNQPVAAAPITYGQLEVSDRHYLSGSTYPAYTAKNVYCFFSAQGIYSGNSMDNIPGGKITLNSFQLKSYSGPNNFAYQYYDTTGNIHSPPFAWSVSGSGAIPAFATTINDPFPVCNNPSQLPDTISVTSGISVPISGSGADSVTLRLFIDLDNVGIQKIKTVAATNTAISFSSQEVAAFFALANDPFRSIQVSYSKYNIQNFAGKNILFKTTASYGRNVQQKP